MYEMYRNTMNTYLTKNSIFLKNAVLYIGSKSNRVASRLPAAIRTII